MPSEPHINIYGYIPSIAAGAVFVALFGLLTLTHFAIVLKSRIWWLLVIVVGGIAECLGWAGRIWSNKNVTSLNAFLTQEICLILAPCFFSAAEYGLLGMAIRALGPEYSLLRPAMYLWIFCLADLVAIVIQAIGGAKAALALENHDKSKTGTYIMVGGISFQLLAMIIFIILGLNFYLKASKNIRHVANKNVAEGRMRTFMIGLSFAALWILIRCIYRVIELAQGWTGFLITHEGYFLGLDAVPMVLCMITFLITHPYFCLPEYASLSRTPDVRVDAETGVAPAPNEKNDAK